jgi:hypothetical protein
MINDVRSSILVGKDAVFVSVCVLFPCVRTLVGVHHHVVKVLRVEHRHVVHVLRKRVGCRTAALFF